MPHPLQQRFCVFLFFLLALLQHHAVADDKQPVRVGLLPYLSTQKLIERFSPVKHYLEQTLHRPVILETAPNFAIYVERARTHQYDMYLAAPHIAALAEQDFHYRRISRLDRALNGSIVVQKDGPIHSIRDLQHQRFATPENTAIVTMLGEQLLTRNHLQSGKNITIIHTNSHNTAILAVFNRQADAAVVSAAVFETMPEDIKQNLMILTKTEDVPHMMFMAGPQLTDQEYTQLKSAMLKFTANGAGREFFQRSGYGDMREISNEDMHVLKPFVIKLRTRLAITNSVPLQQSSPVK